MSPRSSSSAAFVPVQLEPLVDQLAGLSAEEQALVVRAAQRKRRSKIELKAVPWDALLRASGTVAFGGDAVEDTNAIYDV